MSVKSKSIQDKTEELNELVAWFDSDNFVVETALEKFKQAETLASEIEADLRAVQNEIQIVKQKFDAATS